MATEWPITTIGNLAASISETHSFRKEQLIFLNTSDIFQGKVLHCNYSAVNDLPGQAKKSIRKGDILFSEIRPANGRYAYIDFDTDDYVVSTKLMVIRDRNQILPKYLYHFLTSKQTTYWLQHLAESRSGTFPQITFDQVASLELSLPPKSAQKAIVEFADTLDHKIELNRRMNETLESMAQTIFKSWFVNFGPVRAKDEGRDPGLPKPITDLFPDYFEDSEQDEIPAGWRVGTVAEEFNLTMGQSPPGVSYNETMEGMPFYQGRADFGFRFPTHRVYCTAPTRFVETGDTLVSVRAPVGDINMAAERCCIGHGVAAVRRKSGSRSYTYYFLHAIKEVFDRFEAEGTVFGSISKKDFHNIRRIMPPIPIVNAFERLAVSIDDKIANNDQETRTLAALRDTLLPKLISGELRVNDALREVQEAPIC